MNEISEQDIEDFYGWFHPAWDPEDVSEALGAVKEAGLTAFDLAEKLHAENDTFRSLDNADPTETAYQIILDAAKSRINHMIPACISEDDCRVITRGRRTRYSWSADACNRLRAVIGGLPPGMTCHLSGYGPAAFLLKSAGIILPKVADPIPAAGNAN